MSSIRAMTPLVWAVLGLAIASPARADARCSAALVVEANEANEAWGGLGAELPERVRRTLEGREDIDTCARVELARHGAAIRVNVRLADGRRATRTVPSEEDVIPTLEALLLVPEVEGAESDREGARGAMESGALGAAADPGANQAAPASPRAKRPRDEPPSPRYPMFDAAPQRPSEVARSDDALGVEVSLVTGARVGDGQRSLGLGLLARTDLWGWLAVVEGRVDSYAAEEGTPLTRLELAALGGHRFRFESVALDVAAGPALAITGESTQVSGPAGARVVRSPGAVPRLRACSHLHFWPRSLLRAFIGVDSEIGGRGPIDSGIPNALPPLPGLPVWMVGLALGATVGTE